MILTNPDKKLKPICASRQSFLFPVPSVHVLLCRMTDNTNDKAKTDWSQVAKDALDLWQNHLTSLAVDPKAKEELVRFVSPMSEMFAGWSGMMQQGLQGMMQAAAAQQGNAAGFAAPFTPPAADAAPQNTPDDGIDAAASSGDHSSFVPEQEPSVPDHDASEPVSVVSSVEPAVCDAAAGSAAAPSRGRAAASDGSRSLAELAGRLAVLERELDQLRPRARRRDAESGAADDDQRVAGADQG